MRKTALLLLGIPALADAFTPPLAVSAPRTANIHGIRTAVCSTAPGPSRRDVLLAGIVGLPAAFALTKAEGVQALQYDASNPESRKQYLEDTESIRKSRYTRQPTRTDMERNVKKIVQLRTTLDEMNAAAKAKDAAGIATAIGDLTIEATKKNVSLGLEIPVANKAKSYMYSFAQNFSKGADSPITVDLKKAADAFFVAIQAASAAGTAGDADGAIAAVGAANEAIKAYADTIEAETLNGRINSIKVSVMGLFNDDKEAVMDSYKANKQMQKDGKDKNFL